MKAYDLRALSRSIPIPVSTSLSNLGSLPIARYHQIYLVLREQILEGQFPPDTPLPGDLDLATQFGVSRITVRTALDRLVDEQLIERHRGRGTFVRPVVAVPAKARAPMSGLLENIVMMGLKTTVRVIDLTNLPAPNDVAEMLHIAPGTLVQKAIRVRSHKGAPVSHITTFVPAALATKLGRRELSAKPMLTLLEESGVKVASADQTVSARLADATVAPLLDLDVGAPLLAVTRIVVDTRGKPVQLLRGLYRPDRYEYQMHLSRSGGDEPRVWVHTTTIKSKGKS